MKRLLIIFALFLFAPLSIGATENLNLKKLEDNMTLDCEKYGVDSCFARFLAMAGCTYAMGIKSEKTPAESMDIGAKLFVAITNGNKLDRSRMFDKDNKLKKAIRQETLERMGLCKSIIDEAAQVLYRNKHGKDPDAELTQKIAKGLVWNYVNMLDEVRGELNK